MQQSISGAWMKPAIFQLILSCPNQEVAPTTTVSLPRLELLAALTNARLLKFDAESLTLKKDRVVCWTESMVTLQWIRGSVCQ